MHPKFTNVDSLLSVNRGESISKVIDKLGFMPNDVYVQQTTGYKIVVYKYKIKEREIAPDIKDHVGSEKAGNEKYRGKLHDVYFIFDSNDKLILLAKTINVVDNIETKFQTVIKDNNAIYNLIIDVCIIFRTIFRKNY